MPMVMYLDSLRQKLKDNIFVFQYAQVIRYIVSFAVSVIMVRSALPAVDLGNYEIAIFVVASLTSFWVSGIKNAVFTWKKSANDDNGRILEAQVFWVITFVSIFIAVLVFLFSKDIFTFFSLPYESYLLLFVILYILVSVPLVLVETFLYLRNNGKELLLYTHWSQFSLLLITLMAAWIKPTLETFLMVVVFHSLLRYLFLTVQVLGKYIFILKLEVLQSFLLFSLPMIMTVILGSLMDMIDGWFVTKYFHADYFPIFKYGAREMPLSSLLFSSLSVAMIPIISSEGIDSDTLKRKVTHLMHWLFPVSAILMVISPMLFPILYDVSYKESAFIFNIYLLILTSRVLLPQTYCLATHHVHIIIWSGIIEVLANILLSYWWMQLWGIYGLAFATVVAYFIQKLILIAYNFKQLGITFSYYVDVRYYVLYSLALIFIFIISFYYFQ